MSREHFNSLDTNMQACILWDLGKLVDERKEDNVQVCLYQVATFYVEMHRHAGTQKITAFKSLSDHDLQTLS